MAARANGMLPRRLRGKQPLPLWELVQLTVMHFRKLLQVLSSKGWTEKLDVVTAHASAAHAKEQFRGHQLCEILLCVDGADQCEDEPLLRTAAALQGVLEGLGHRSASRSSGKRGHEHNHHRSVGRRSVVSGADVAGACCIAEALTGLLQSWVVVMGQSAAHPLLGVPGFQQALCSTASWLIDHQQKNNGAKSAGSDDGGVVKFRRLRVCRSASELAAVMLEEASTETRAACEKQLLQGPTAQLLADGLVVAMPDPCVHETLLELVWRGLRRAESTGSSGSGQDAPLELQQRIESLVGEQPCAKLQGLTAGQVLEWGMDVALQLNRHGRQVVVWSRCSLRWGTLLAEGCMATMSTYSMIVSGDFDKAGHVASLELPWLAVQAELKKTTAAEVPNAALSITIDLQALASLGTLLPPYLAKMASGGCTAVELSCQHGGASTEPWSNSDSVALTKLLESVAFNPCRGRVVKRARDA